MDHDAVAAISLERFDMLPGEAFERHAHDEHQLAWASSGVLMVEVEDRCWVLPPNLALWIPSGRRHGVAAVRASVLQGVYIDPRAAVPTWAEPTVVSVIPLARELIGYLAGSDLSGSDRSGSDLAGSDLAGSDLSGPARARAEAILFDVLRPVGQVRLELPLPSDPRARAVAEALLADPTDRRSLEQLARDVRSSPRTLLRIFLTQTHLTFNEWRMHARLQAAVALLAEGMPVARVAARVGYATPSAFVAAFRRVTGHTPAAYFGRAAP